MAINASEKHASDVRTKLLNLKSALETSLRQIDECVKVEQTGQMVLLKIVGDTFEFVGIYKDGEGIWKDGKWSDEEEPEWDLCLPIPKPETVPEFQGF